MEYKNLTSFQLDALREVSNIGAGNSATALSMLLGTKIDMSVPNMNIIEFDELFNNYKENEVVAVLVKVLDDIPGSVLYIFEEDVALNMISKMTYKDENWEYYILIFYECNCKFYRAKGNSLCTCSS